MFSAKLGLALVCNIVNRFNKFVVIKKTAYNGRQYFFFRDFQHSSSSKYLHHTHSPKKSKLFTPTPLFLMRLNYPVGYLVNYLHHYAGVLALLAVLFVVWLFGQGFY